MNLRNKALFTLFLHLFLFILHGKENHYRLKGVIDNRFNEYPVMLFAFNEDSILRVDTTKVTTGTFSFEGEESLNDIAVITIGNYPDTVVSRVVILERGDIKVNMDNGRVSGTPLNDLYQIHLDTMVIFDEKFLKLTEESGDPGHIETGSPRYKKLVEQGKYMVGFKSRNIHNVVGRYFFEQESGRYFAERLAYPSSDACVDSAFYIIYNLVDSLYKQRDWVQNHIKLLERVANERQQEKLLIGKAYSDFILTDREGNKKSISTYISQSRYTVLEFWASWCGPCIAAIPKLKRSYDKYGRTDLEIVGISIDRSALEWKKGLEKIDAPWVQFLVDAPELQKEIMKAYAFNSIPFSVLIDKEGYIVHTGHTDLVIEYFNQIIN